MSPFLTFYTPTYRRPRLLGKCLSSVWMQTAVDDIEQIVVPDHVGVGVGGMYDRIPDYASAVHGDYVHILADDDELATPTAVAALRDDVRGAGNPPLVICRARKGVREFPRSRYWPPAFQQIDLGCLVIRADVWRANLGAYGGEYIGDYLLATALARQGIEPHWTTVLLVVGGVLNGAPEKQPLGLDDWTLEPVEATSDAAEDA